MSGQPDPAALQDMIDKMEIGELQSRYMYALDWQDAETYGSVFTEEAVLSWPEGHAEGRANIQAACARMREFVRKRDEADAPAKPARLRHFLANRVIEVQGDRARAVAYWFDLSNDNQPRWPYIPAYGLYEDELARTPDGWRFTSRKIYNEISGESPAENPAW